MDCAEVCMFCFDQSWFAAQEVAVQAVAVAAEGGCIAAVPLYANFCFDGTASFCSTLGSKLGLSVELRTPGNAVYIPLIFLSPLLYHCLSLYANADGI